MNSKHNPYLPDATNNEPPKTQPDTMSSEQAVALARAKLRAIHSSSAVDSETAPKEDQTPVNPPVASTYHLPSTPKPLELYKQEQQLQDQMQPGTHHANPSHELPPGPSRPLPTEQTRTQQIKAFSNSQPKKQGLRERLKFWKQPQRPTDTKNADKKSPLFKTALTTALVLVLYNQQVIMGQVQYYISPGDNLVTPQIIEAGVDDSVGPEPKIIIPKINVDVPVVYGLNTRDDRIIQEALEDGVVHYGGTAEPGQVGNTVIVGHSSNSFWNSGKYKFAFVLLDRIDVGDTFIMHFEGKRYIYEVFNKKVIEPTDFSVVDQNTNNTPTVTLITCTPPGTSWRRLVVQAQQISPDPESAEKAQLPELSAEENNVVPGNTPSLWDNIRDFLFGND